MGELQGGQKVRVLLAQALFGNPTALLLDEPTNNLDLDSVHWLQKYLTDYEGVLIVISHDRHFLNSVCTHTADIDYETVIMYVGGYDDMVVAKTQIRSRIESENAQREKKIAQLNEFIARFSAGTRSAQATSRKKEVERLATSELARSNIQRPYIKFDMKRNSGRHPLEIKSIEKSYDTLKVIPRFTASVTRGEKIALMGRNGAGKTTMLKSLVRNAPGFIDDSDKQFPVNGGQVIWGHEVTVGYFAQDHTDSITRDNTTSIDWLWQFDPSANQQELRGLMGQMLFSGDDALKPTRALSGGESARLIFCKLMLQKPNFLVLDEPTNHLDLESINALNISLAALRRHRSPRHPRPRRHRRSRHPHLALPQRQNRRLQGPLRRIRRLRRRKSLVTARNSIANALVRQRWHRPLQFQRSRRIRIDLENFLRGPGRLLLISDRRLRPRYLR